MDSHASGAGDSPQVTGLRPAAGVVASMAVFSAVGLAAFRLFFVCGKSLVWSPDGQSGVQQAPDRRFAEHIPVWVLPQDGARVTLAARGDLRYTFAKRLWLRAIPPRTPSTIAAAAAMTNPRRKPGVKYRSSTLWVPASS